MKKTVYQSDFIQAFTDMSREDNFTKAGLVALYDYITDLEDEGLEEYDLDVIALCCEFNEYENIEEFHNDYDSDDYPTIEDIEQATTVIMINEEAFIIQAF